MRYRWKPSKAQARAYHERMQAIEELKSSNDDKREEYSINCTGDCCINDEIALFNADKSDERQYGKIISESYGSEKQQHTFTIQLEDDDRILIKGRNLYKSDVYRKKWNDETQRSLIINEKHERDALARASAETRRQTGERFI